MKRFFIPLLITGALIFSAYYFLRTYVFWEISPKSLITKFRVPQKNIKEYLPQGDELSYPLTLPVGFNLGIFADLRGSFPRALAFDERGVLFASVPAKGKVLALPDRDADGKADRTVEVMTGLDKPHGIAFDGGYIYVGETNRVIRASYNSESLTAGTPQKLFDLPGGGRHFTRTIRIEGGKLYTSVGSSCDTCIESHPFRAAVLVSDLDGANLRVFAKGLRNTVFFTFDSGGKMWGTDMGRDFLGDNLPPDEVNLIEDGKDYGWPYCYGSKVRDSKFKPGENLSYCADTTPPKFELPAHVAPLGITFIHSDSFPGEDQGNILVALHGSWNSSVPVGYKIVKLSLLGGFVMGSTDFIAGFIDGKEVFGRPVDLIFDKTGYLYISDDNTGLIYILSKR
ncbi:PQQ-dependent sugar dehydrogenase [Candidatus Woesebacteria bacterium]|nr:PQQ-dependent sugar dehydrogenase [Candidatus Woesebacteria bacterium]